MDDEVYTPTRNEAQVTTFSLTGFPSLLIFRERGRNGATARNYLPQHATVLRDRTPRPRESGQTAQVLSPPRRLSRRGRVAAQGAQDRKHSRGARRDPGAGANAGCSAGARRAPARYRDQRAILR